jgi:hypothetical protein
MASSLQEFQDQRDYSANHNAGTSAPHGSLKLKKCNVGFYLTDIVLAEPLDLLIDPRDVASDSFEFGQYQSTILAPIVRRGKGHDVPSLKRGRRQPQALTPDSIWPSIQR